MKPGQFLPDQNPDQNPDLHLERLLLRLVTEPFTKPLATEPARLPEPQPEHSEIRQQLQSRLLSTAWQVRAFALTQTTITSVVEQRLQQLQKLYPVLTQFCQAQLGWPTCPIVQLWDLWLPLAEQLALWQQALPHPLIQGILGVQGTGKTTLTRILAEILRQMGLQVGYLSLDDLYKTYAERQQLQRFDPRFCWRGPPGTHDLELGLTVLSQLRQGQFPVAVPRFDKSVHAGAGERTQPEWLTEAEIVLFEGWFVGVRPIDPQAFETAPWPIQTAADRAFAREINQRLQDYMPLWEQIDRLLVLYPQDYRLSQQWRGQAEQQMWETGRGGMSAEAVDQFVEYFWRALHPELYVKPMLEAADQVDLVIRVAANHSPEAIYQP
jgi:D-glycerate 3-kinase